MHPNHGASPGPPGAGGSGGQSGENADPAALWRVFKKLRHLSGALGEIDDYFDSRAPAPASVPAAREVTLENLDAHIRRETRSR